MGKKIRRSVKRGLAPGTLVYIGEDSGVSSKISMIQYNETELRKTEIPSYNSTIFEKAFTNWLNIDGLNNIELLKKIGSSFNLHSLTLEDILNTEQRPKIETYDSYTYIVFKMLSYNEKTRSIESEQISLIVKDNVVISFQEKSGDVFDPVRERINQKDSRIRRKECDYLIYALMDTVVDNYFLILEKIGDEIEEIEQKILTNADEKVLQELYALKRNIIRLRKSVWPLRELINSLERSENIKSDNSIYLRDLYDHTIQVIDNIENLRDIISGLMDIYLTTISNRMNSVMKVLTIISTIFIPLTFIAGVYGMNFEFMPELSWKMGYPITLVLMFMIVIVMMIFFRFKKWL